MSGTVGVDIGGSGIRAAFVNGAELGTIASRRLEGRSVDEVISTLIDCIEGLDAPAQTLGIGVPGFVRAGTVLSSPNFPAWREVPLERILRKRLGVDVHVENDANAATLGAWHRLGGGVDFVQLTLGTGVGGGVVSGGQVLRGAGGTGAELGHIYAGGERVCGCGGVGCLETWLGTQPLVDACRARGLVVDNGHEVVEAAREGSAAAREVLEAAADALGRGLTTIVNIFNPDVIRICGGLAGAADLIGARSEAWLMRHGVQPSAKHVKFIWGGRADADAILGAAMAAVTASAGSPRAV